MTPDELMAMTTSLGRREENAASWRLSVHVRARGDSCPFGASRTITTS
jgi:hypothetical protein